jgi:hypothetical protein
MRIYSITVIFRKVNVRALWAGKPNAKSVETFLTSKAEFIVVCCLVTKTIEFVSKETNSRSIIYEIIGAILQKGTENQ